MRNSSMDFAPTVTQGARRCTTPFPRTELCSGHNDPTLTARRELCARTSQQRDADADAGGFSPTRPREQAMTGVCLVHKVRPSICFPGCGANGAGARHACDAPYNAPFVMTHALLGQPAMQRCSALSCDRPRCICQRQQACECRVRRPRDFRVRSAAISEQGREPPTERSVVVAVVTSLSSVHDGQASFSLCSLVLLVLST